jgi:hypothetical protein
MPALRATHLGLALLVWAAGCELLVDGKLHEIRCQDEGAVGPPACPEGSACTAGVCLASKLRAACTVDADCAAGDLCLDPATWGGRGAKRCTRACCTSADCEPDRGSICAPASAGAGNFCLAAADYGRIHVGEGAAGAACAADRDCRSGRCVLEHCADTCCSDTSCAAGDQICAPGGGPDEDTPGFWCAPAPPSGKAGRYVLCKENIDCASGLCIPIAPEGTLRCSEPCCGSSACEMMGEKPVACSAVQVGSVWLRACSAVVQGTATGSVGSPCLQNGDCRSGDCQAAEGEMRCVDVCCTDASCGDPSGFSCRPVTRDASWALRCEPR